MLKLSKSSACGDIKRHLWSHGANALMQDQDGANDQQPANDTAQDISNTCSALTKILEDFGGLTTHYCIGRG